MLRASEFACPAHASLKQVLNILRTARPVHHRFTIPEGLTAAQIETARLIYSPGVNRSTKREVGGLLPGSELGWTDLGWTASARATGLDQFRFLVYGDPGWDIQKFDFDRDLARAEEIDRDTLNALDPNLKPFIDRGGKLIQFHGWPIRRSRRRTARSTTRASPTPGGAARVHDSYRLFRLRGWGIAAAGTAQTRSTWLRRSSNGSSTARRPIRFLRRTPPTAPSIDAPLCPFPQLAAYRGTGSIDDAANFRGR